MKGQVRGLDLSHPQSELFCVSEEQKVDRMQKQGLVRYQQLESPGSVGPVGDRLSGVGPILPAPCRPAMESWNFKQPFYKTGLNSLKKKKRQGYVRRR